MVTSVDQDAFEYYGDWEDYVRDLNEIYCGTRDISEIEDDLHGNYVIK